MVKWADFANLSRYKRGCLGGITMQKITLSGQIMIKLAQQVDLGLLVADLLLDLL